MIIESKQRLIWYRPRFVLERGRNDIQQIPSSIVGKLELYLRAGIIAVSESPPEAPEASPLTELGGETEGGSDDGDGLVAADNPVELLEESAASEPELGPDQPDEPTPHEPDQPAPHEPTLQAASLLAEGARRSRAHERTRPRRR